IRSLSPAATSGPPPKGSHVVTPPSRLAARGSSVSVADAVAPEPTTRPTISPAARTDRGRGRESRVIRHSEYGPGEQGRERPRKSEVRPFRTLYPERETIMPSVSR